LPEPLSIHANTVRLRDFEPRDVDDAAAVIGDDRVTHWLSFDSRDRTGAERMIAAAGSAAAVQPRTEYYLAIADPQTDRVLGFARLAIGAAQSAKLGYAIHADHWGRGHATDAVRAVIALGFETLDLHRITAAVGPDNRLSQAVLKHLGFSEEGRLRDHVFTNGAWRDSVLYSLLINEWNAPQRAEPSIHPR
jgi:ribosomal-protein-alanine N-acetyltransferase